MSDRLRSLRTRTNGFTLTAQQYQRVTYAALGAMTLIVLTGAAVRLTGSGLGCPDWPRCFGKEYPPFQFHALIEYGNRVLTGLVSLTTAAAVIGAWRLRPYRRSVFRLSLLLPVGVFAQAILGGFTVRGDLDYGYVMAHLMLSMMVLDATVALAWCAAHQTDWRKRASDRTAVWAVRALFPIGALTILAGTAATAAGPHAGGAPGQKINRLDFKGSQTLDFVIHQHGALAAALGVFAVGLWFVLRRRGAEPGLRRAVTAVCVLLAAQGVVGITQFELHLPPGIVWLHVALAAITWLSILWSVAAAGRLEPAPSAAPSEASARPVQST